MAVSLVIRAKLAAGIFSEDPSDQNPVWDQPGQSITYTYALGEAVDILLDDLVEDPEGNLCTFTILQGSLTGTGLVQSGDRGERISGTTILAGQIALAIEADDYVEPSAPNNADADFAVRAALTNMVVAENFPITTYADRGELLAAYKAADLADPFPQNGVKSTYYPPNQDSDQNGGPDHYEDPPPNGGTAKLLLDTTPGKWLTGGQALRTRILAAEGATEAGPVLEFAFTPRVALSEYYVQFVIMFDPICLTFNNDSNSRKIFFLNDFGPGAGQIVNVLHLEEGPWPVIYRYNPGAMLLYNNHNTGIGGRSHQMYGALNLTGITPTTAAQWDQKYGPSRENFRAPSITDQNLLAVPRPIGNQYCVITHYINLNYFHPTLGITNGMHKMWFAQYGTAPTLLNLSFRNCGFRSEAATESVRSCWRPENPKAFPGVEHGHWIDQVLVRAVTNQTERDQGIPFPGDFALPHPGTQIPAGFPIANTHDSIGD